MATDLLTVAGLIEKLQQFPADMPVVTAGFDEWGFDHIGYIEPVVMTPVEQTSHGPAFVEPHEAARPAARYKITGESFTALCLDR